jgi:uncharacterized protein RhaS with RHS repeats
MSYDANGNLTGDGTWSYGYDLDNRLKSANKTGTAASLAYDAEGRLRQTAIGSSTTNLLYDATDLIAEYDAAGTTIQRRYVHGPGTDEPIVWYEGSEEVAAGVLPADPGLEQVHVHRTTPRPGQDEAVPSTKRSA